MTGIYADVVYINNDASCWRACLKIIDDFCFLLNLELHLGWYTSELNWDFHSVKLGEYKYFRTLCIQSGAKVFLFLKRQIQQTTYSCNFSFCSISGVKCFIIHWELMWNTRINILWEKEIVQPNYDDEIPDGSTYCTHSIKTVHFIWGYLLNTVQHTAKEYFIMTVDKQR